MREAAGIVLVSWLLAGAAGPGHHDVPWPGRAAEAPGQPADAPGTYALPPIGPAPEFLLTDAATGRPVRLADFAGRPLLLSFIYTRCPDPTACPLASRTLAAVQAGLAGRAVRVHLASVTFDPARDDAATLRAYARAHGANPALWRMLRPESAPDARRLLAAFDHPVFPQADGSLAHPLRVYLIDGWGRIRQIYSQAWLDPAQVLADVETLHLEAVVCH